MYFVYIIYPAIWDKYYIGSCANLDVRIQQHNSGKNISTRHGVPWVLKYTEVCEVRSNAMKREVEIKKKKSRKYIEWLISTIG